MLDFVFIVGNKDESTHRENLAEIYNYAIFLKLPLELWMFIPCDDDGNVLEKPKFYYTTEALCSLKIGVELNTAMEINREVEKHQQAKEKCLFNGFEVKIYDSQLQSINSLNILDIYWKSKEYGKEWYLSKGLRTINDLVNYGLELTEFSINKIYSNEAER